MSPMRAARLPAMKVLLEPRKTSNAGEKLPQVMASACGPPTSPKGVLGFACAHQGEGGCCAAAAELKRRALALLATLLASYDGAEAFGRRRGQRDRRRPGTPVCSCSPASAFTNRRLGRSQCPIWVFKM